MMLIYINNGRDCRTSALGRLATIEQDTNVKLINGRLPVMSGQS